MGARLLLVTSKHVKHKRLSLDVVNKGLGNVNRDLQTQQHFQKHAEMGPPRWTGAYLLHVVERKLVVSSGFQRLSREDLITLVDEAEISLMIVMRKGFQDTASCEGTS